MFDYGFNWRVVWIIYIGITRKVLRYKNFPTFKNIKLNLFSEKDVNHHLRNTNVCSAVFEVIVVFYFRKYDC